MNNYRIEAAVFKIPLPGFNRFGHAFWILKNCDTNQIAATLHGLATSRRTGKIIPIGYRSEHALRAFHFCYEESICSTFQIIPATFALPAAITQTVYQGSDVLERWLRAVKQVSSINKLDLNYPRLGCKLRIRATINSNSIYKTLGHAMGLEVPRFKGIILVGFNNEIAGL